MSAELRTVRYQSVNNYTSAVFINIHSRKHLTVLDKLILQQSVDNKNHQNKRLD